MNRNFLILSAFLVLIISCSQKKKTSPKGPLSTFYNSYDKKEKEDFLLQNAILAYKEAYSKNDDSKIKEAENKINKIHQTFLESIKDEFTSNNIEIPFTQKDKQLFTVSSIEVTDFYYPWSTAPRMAFEMRIHYQLHQTNFRYKTMRLEWFDTDEDIIYGIHLPINQLGYSDFKINPEQEFRKLKNVIIL